MEKQFLITSDSGINWFLEHENDGTIRARAEQDITALLDRNKAMANHNDGWSPTKELRRVAFIPDIIALKWLHEEGWWYQDPGAADKLKQKLNDPDYLHLRTAPGRV